MDGKMSVRLMLYEAQMDGKVGDVLGRDGMVEIQCLPRLK